MPRGRSDRHEVSLLGSASAINPAASSEHPRRGGRGVTLADPAPMAVKKMLPIIGVGSAAALIGLVASRRFASPRTASPGLGSRQRPSGIRVRPQGELPPSDELPAAPQELPPEFWDAAPESASREEEMAPSAFAHEPYESSDRMAPSAFAREPYESSDRDDLTAEWLARATQAPGLDDTPGEDPDDPAEIPADSLSMISDASRYAAAQPDDDAEIPSERQ